MGKKFSEVCNSKDLKEEAYRVAEENNIDIEDIKNSYNKYCDLSSNELYNELLKEIEKKKSKDGISLQDIDNIKNTLYPILNQEQKNELNKLLKLFL